MRLGDHTGVSRPRTLTAAVAAAARCAQRRTSRSAAPAAAAPLPLRPRAAVKAAATATDAEAAAPWEQDWDEMGPAFRTTLELLEWPALCEHVASFASTAVGKRLCRRLEVPLGQAESERLLEEARCVLSAGGRRAG